MDVYGIQVTMRLAGNLAPELMAILKNMQTVDKAARSVEKSMGRWGAPLNRASTAADKLKRDMDGIHRATHRVEREAGKIAKAMTGARAPGTAMDREMARWAAAIAHPIAQMRTLRSETAGVASAARGVSRSFDGWANKVSAAVNSVRRLSAAAAGVHLPPIQRGGGGGNGSGPRGARTHAHAGRRGHAMGEREGSYVAGMIGVGGSIGTMEYILTQGAGAGREDIRAKNAGLSPDEIAGLRAQAGELTNMYPSLSNLGVREQGRLLIPNVGDIGKTKELLPEYMRAQVALQTMSGPEGGAKDIAYLSRAIDLMGRSTSVPDTRMILDGFVRSRQLDPEAVKGNDFVNAAQSAGSAGKALSADFWSTVMPAFFMQQGGSRTGTDVASAFQNTIIGRGTNESILAQYDEGYRVGATFKTGKDGKRKLLNKGGFLDEELYQSNFHEWNKKHVIPKMIAKGMLPEGWAKGDYSQKITDEQRAAGTKYIAEKFSNRRGASLHTMDILEMDQMEALLKRLRNARGTADVEADQKNDAFVVGQSIKTNAGNAASKLSEGSMLDILREASRLAGAFAVVADALEKNPNAAKTAFGVGAGVTGGLAAAGLTALTLAAGATLSIPAIAVGAGATVTILGALIPWKEIFGIGPGDVADAFDSLAQGKGQQGNGLDGMPKLFGDPAPDGSILPSMEKVSGVASDAYDAVSSVFGKLLDGFGKIGASRMPMEYGAYDFGRGGKAGALGAGGIPVLPAPGSSPTGTMTMPSLADPTVGGAPAVIKQAGEAIGVAGTAASTAAPGLTATGAGIDAVKAAADGAQGSLSALAARISALGSMSMPGAAPGAGAVPSAAPSATPGKQGSYAPPPRTSAPIQVASTIMLNERAVGRSVTRHQIAQANTRNGTQSFDDNTLKTPVGYSAPIVA